jgi:hypothetical protein
MSHEITFPQGILRITESLSSGLMHLRRGKKERLLWIDQLCINQEDKMEKTQQIMLMRQIYSSAGRVLVWLGADEGNGSIALGLLKQIGKLETNTLQSRSVSAPWMAANQVAMAPGSHCSTFGVGCGLEEHGLYRSSYWQKML